VSAARETILVVDDDAPFRSFACDLLARAGFSVAAAADAEEALALAQRRPPQLVLLDVKLPRVSGYELLKQLRDRLGGELPVVFVSGERTDVYDRVAGLLLGADDYIVKPFDPSELIARVRRLVRPAPEKANRAASEAIDSLTRREREVLGLLADGRGSGEIADELAISPRTLDTHVQHILSKLDVRNRAQAVAFAHRSGFGDDEAFAAHVASSRVESGRLTAEPGRGADPDPRAGAHPRPQRRARPGLARPRRRQAGSRELDDASHGPPSTPAGA
jgi:DNA-binding NarL/FixJ family response regulator